MVVCVSTVSIRKQLGPDLFSFIFMISDRGKLFSQLAVDAALATFLLDIPDRQVRPDFIFVNQ